MRINRRGFAMLLCAAMLLTLIVSSAYIAHELAHPHDCVGEDCPICETIAQLEQVSKDFGLALLVLFLLGLLNAVQPVLAHTAARRAIASLSLIGWKVRLND